jgi:hypothetical protein
MVGLRFEGQYRTTPAGDHSPMVYVRGGTVPTYMTEAAYRAKGYLLHALSGAYAND